jgi:putative transposase
VGLSSFVVLSDGTEIENPRLLQKLQKHLRGAQRRVARRKKLSKRWKKAVRSVAKIHRKVFNQRNDFQHQLSRDLVNNYGLMAMEDLKVIGLSRGMLSKAVHDAAWAAFFRKLSYMSNNADSVKPFFRILPFLFSFEHTRPFAPKSGVISCLCIKEDIYWVIVSPL